jgi:hypothetical protein
MKKSILNEAVRVAYEKAHNHPMHKRGYMLFSFVIENNKILGYGMNNRDMMVPLHYGYSKRARGWGNFTPCVHSEVHAWIKCRGLVKGSFELINIRIRDDGNLGMSCPCECCQSWMKAQGCESVHFTTGSNWAKMALT